MTRAATSINSNAACVRTAIRYRLLCQRGRNNELRLPAKSLRPESILAAVNADLCSRLDVFLRPLYQDLDGRSRVEEMERIASIARQLHAAAGDREAREFELLLRFHLLGRWLEKVGNASRVALSVGGISEQELHATAASIRRLDAPVTTAERAVAAAVLIDGSGVRGLAEQFARARREGSSLLDVVRSAVADARIPEWLPAEAEEWLMQRREARREVCRRLLEELQGDDRQPSTIRTCST